jgi:hypothetical protein
MRLALVRRWRLRVKRRLRLRRVEGDMQVGFRLGATVSRILERIIFAPQFDSFSFNV